MIDAGVMDASPMLEALRNLLGFEFVLKNPLGSPFSGLPKRHSLHENPFCRKVKAGLVAKCAENDCVLITARAVKERGPFVHECHAGILEAVFPIFLADGSFAGVVLAGPFRKSKTSSAPGDVVLRPLDRRVLGALTEVMSMVTDRVSGMIERKTREELERRIENPKIQKAVEFIERNFKEPLVAGDAAKAAGLGESRFIHLFKKQTGRGFSEYLRHVRMEAAKEILSSGGPLGLFETAVECGYRDQAYFGKIFREEVGMSPGKYRRLHRTPGFLRA